MLPFAEISGAKNAKSAAWWLRFLISGFCIYYLKLEGVNRKK